MERLPAVLLQCKIIQYVRTQFHYDFRLHRYLNLASMELQNKDASGKTHKGGGFIFCMQFLHPGRTIWVFMQLNVLIFIKRVFSAWFVCMHPIGNRLTAYIIYTYLWYLISSENPFKAGLHSLGMNAVIDCCGGCGWVIFFSFNWCIWFLETESLSSHLYWHFLMWIVWCQ